MEKKFLNEVAMKTGRGILIFLALMAILAISCYLRLYWYWEGGPAVKQNSGRYARNMAYQSLRAQIRSQVDTFLPLSPEDERSQIADLRTKEVIAAEPGRFDAMVAKAVERIGESLRERRAKPYLLEADPYYYYHLTELVRDSGAIGSEYRGGKFFNHLRMVPEGAWAPVTAHPYIGFYFYRLLCLIRPAISLMEALGYLPVVLAAAAVVAFFGLSRLMGVSALSAVLSSLTFALAPIFIQRSAFGWYDTDPYNHLFPIAVMALFIKGAGPGRHSVFLAVFAGALTGLYSLFWQGWPFIFILISASAILLALIRGNGERGSFKAPALFLPVYFLSTVIFAVLSMTPAGFLGSLSEGWSALRGFSRAEDLVRPNIFLTVGEAQSISTAKLVHLAGYYGTFCLALLGAVASGIIFWRRKDSQSFSGYLTVTASAAVLFVMSLRTERFTFLFVLPFSVLVGFGIDSLRIIFSQMPGRGIFVKMPPVFARWASLLLAVGLVFPVPGVLAMAVAKGINPIMNDVWVGVLRDIRERTPKNAVIHSWWPPGYFIVSLAGRSVSSDGGSQHLPVVYWIAKAFLSDDERRAAGIFRMVNTSGDGAFEYLRSLEISAEKAVELILRAVPMGRDEAEATLMAELKEEQREKLLDLTHGVGTPRPTYVFLYNDMIEQNLALQLVARWNFGKARMLLDERKRLRTGLFKAVADEGKRIFFEKGLGAEKCFQSLGLCSRRAALSFVVESPVSPAGALSEFFAVPLRDRLLRACNLMKIAVPGNYVLNVLSVTDGILKYMPEAPLAGREKDVLSFQNGLRVNLRTMDSFVNLPDGNIRGRPVSLVSMEEGKLTERVNGGERVNVSALLFKRDGSPMAVFADRNLLRSLLFRLYYLEGAGLSCFKLFSKKSDAGTKTRLEVYEVNWGAFE